MKKKKGFTLVELLVVIAILAVLATVSVVGYMGFTKKAHESNDASLTAQMNTALQANGVVKKNKTLTEAREDLLEAGIDLEKVTPTTDGYSYVWDSKQDLMFLLNENREVVAPTNATISANTVDSFVVVHNETEFNTWKSNYSLYFANGYESQTLTLTKLVGIDAGTSGINDISVKDDSSTADVTMYTTSGTLTIDAGQATVRHYGEAKNVVIKAIAGKSYHEYGTVVGNISITSGHLKVENNARISTVIAQPTDSTTVKLSSNDENSIGTIVTTDTSKTTFNVPESVKPTENVTSDKLTEMNDFAGGFGTERSPYLIENENQFVNIGKYSSQMKNGKSFIFKLIDDIDLRDYKNDFMKFGSSNNIEAISGYFRGELDGKKDNSTNYKLITNDNLSKIFANSIGNTTISNIDYYLNNRLIWLCAGQSGYTNTTFDNVDMYTTEKNTNIELGSNEGLYTSWVAYDVYNDDWARDNNVTIKNADVYVDIVSDSYSAVFFGGSPYFGGSAKIYDSNYYGNFFGSKVNLVLGNLSHNVDYKLIASNVENRGTLAATGGTPMIAGGNYSETNAKEDPKGQFTNVNLGRNRVLNDSKLSIKYNVTGIELTEAESKSAEYYVLTIIGGTRFNPPSSENSSYSFNIKLDKNLFTNGVYQTNFKDGKLVTIAQYKEFVNNEETFDDNLSINVFGEENAVFWIKENNGTIYYVFDFHDNNQKYFITKPNKVITSSPVEINEAKITVYDSENLPIAQKNVELNK